MNNEYIPEDVKESYREYLASKYKDDGFKERFTSALQTIAQQPLSGSPEGSPKRPSGTSDNGKRCTK